MDNIEIPKPKAKGRGKAKPKNNDEIIKPTKKKIEVSLSDTKPDNIIEPIAIVVKIKKPRKKKKEEII